MHHRGLIIILGLLSLALTHCEKRRSGQPALFAGNRVYCDDPLVGEFDVFIGPPPRVGQPYTFQIVTVSSAVDEEGRNLIVRVAVANGAEEIEELVPGARLRPNQTLYRGYLTQADREKYDKLVIVEYDPREPDFLKTRNEAALICDLPEITVE